MMVTEDACESTKHSFILSINNGTLVRLQFHCTKVPKADEQLYPFTSTNIDTQC
jgi:hypothetical protein